MADQLLSTNDVAKIAWEAWIEKNSGPIKAAIAKEAPGDLRQSTAVVTAGTDQNGLRILRAEDTSSHAIYVEEGRGAIDHRHGGSVLRFVTKAGQVVYSRYSRAAKANPFIIRALENYGLRIK